MLGTRLFVSMDDDIEPMMVMPGFGNELVQAVAEDGYAGVGSQQREAQKSSMF